ncbi:MAG: hypothetical protein Q4P13_05925 [Psychrobacter sp.]|nr:hypothetical protein [Psychrobacter sp.]
MANIDKQPSYSAGAIVDISKTLYDELLTSGSSLLESEVLSIVIKSTTLYIAWSGGLQVKSNDDLTDELTSDLTYLNVTPATQLTLDEWAIIEPVARAHAAVIQADRMESMQGLGVAQSGLSKSEATQTYRETVEQMKKEAFQCEPFTVELAGGISTTSISHIWQAFE